MIPTAPSAGGTGRSAEPAGATTAPPAPDTARDANAGAAREPAREPPAPQPSERELIERTLAAYAAAYRRLDTDAVRRIHPTIDGARLRDNFEQTREQTVEIVINEVSVTGNTATVSGLVRTRAEPKVGRPLESNVRTEFRLQKRGSTWVIVERRGA